MEASQTACAGVAVLKVPRTGSTWLTKELRGFPGMQLEFEPFTDGGSGTQCGGRFFTQAVTRALQSRLRCVTREFRARPCYWAWQHCNASRLQPRQMSTRTVVVGFLLNPMYTPGVKWEVAMSLAPRARLIWLRRTNLVKMALSDLRRLAVISSHRHAEPITASRRLQEKSSNISQISRVDPEELLVKINSSLVSQASFPAGLPLEQALLVLYEDMQTHRVLVLRTILRFLGVESIPEIKSEIERQASAYA
ncbi:hypothetical protein AB1Y20_003955 [Prymnesium parvum]|uniref:Sulfotransferase domain-containing protein n=1 Tax=Prymnesium parvum TaxID=97485 RepID=A0AB34J6E7_PRYPA